MSSLLDTLKDPAKLGEAATTLFGQLLDAARATEVSKALNDQVVAPLAALVASLQKPKPLVFATPTWTDLAKQVVAASGGKLELGQQERKNFKDGRGWHRFTQNIEGRHVIVLGGWTNDSELFDLYRTGYNAWHWKADRLTLAIPYHGDGRQERAQLQGESVDALYATTMLTSIPKCPNRNDAILVDIHTDTVTGFFLSGGMQCTNLEALSPMIDRIVFDRFGGKCALAAPDAGRGKVIQKKTKKLNRDHKLQLRTVIASKDRDSDTTETAGIIGDPSGLNVLLSDDMGVSFGSAIGAGKLLKAAGGLEQVLAITHAVCPDNNEPGGKPFIQQLFESGLFAKLYVTDTLPKAHQIKALYPDFVHVEPLAPLLSQHLVSHYVR